jgi:hypothetical protein
MYPLQDFLNHGLLPFTGRAEELDRLLEFWRSTVDGSGMRVALVTGEAGSGKSRLMESLRPLVVRQGGIVIHLRLYPDSSTAIAPLLARALVESKGSADLLQHQPEPTAPGVASAIRHLARLRPVLLALEDVHLLQGMALGELTLLLEGIADETVAVLCFARPPEGAILGVLERYLVLERSLDGLAEKDLASLWCSIFGSEGEPQMIDALARATLGNPLAIRSALRGAMNRKAIASAGGEDRWRVVVTRDEFEHILRRGVEVLSEGMAAHLSVVERHAARTLACIGEIFDPEAAAIILEDASRMIELLTYKGILAVSDISTRALNRTAGNLRHITFTHTLVHRHFVDEAEPDIDRLVRLFASKLPLYSILPFQLLVQHRHTIRSHPDEIERAATTILGAAFVLNTSADWKLARTIWLAGAALIAAGSRLWDDDRYREAEARLQNYRIELELREQDSLRFARRVHRLMRLTEGASTDTMLSLRLSALSQLFISNTVYHPSECMAVHEAVEELVARHPHLRFTRRYLLYLRRVIRTAADAGIDLSSFAEQRAEELSVSADAPEGFAQTIRTEFRPQLLTVITSPEVYARRLAFLREMEAHPADFNPRSFMTKRILLLLSGAYIQELDRILPEITRQVADLGDRRATFFCRLCPIAIDLMKGGSMESAKARVDALLAPLPDEVKWRFLVVVAQHFHSVALLCSDEESIYRMQQQWGIDPSLNYPEIRTLIAHSTGSLQSLPTENRSEFDILLILCIRFATGDAEIDRNELRVRMVRFLEEKPELLRQIATVWTFLALLRREDSDELLDSLHHDIHDWLLRWLPWLAERGAVAIMETMLGRFESYLTRTELRDWRSQTAALRKEQQGQIAMQERNSRLKISMLGTVGITSPGAEPERVKGARVGKFLGLLVADRMLREPLSFREICRLVAGRDDEEPERARKALNDAVYRVRELLGADAVITDREHSQLNMDLVEVDLLEADRLLRDAEEAIRNRVLARALRSMLGVLEITRGEVPFPGLYDDFFEAAREEFEFRLRSALLDIARRLLREGDTAGAGDLLRRGFEAMPEDEEIGDMLHEALERSGRFTEAERVKMRTEQGVEG